MDLGDEYRASNAGDVSENWNIQREEEILEQKVSLHMDRMSGGESMEVLGADGLVGRWTRSRALENKCTDNTLCLADYFA